MSGLLDGLLPDPQSSEVPLLGPILGGGDDEATETPEVTRPVATPIVVLPTPTPEDEEDAARNDRGDDADTDVSRTLPSDPEETPTPVRTRPTFIITAVPSDEAETSASLPAEITPSALPTLPSIPGPEDELIQAPPPSISLPLPTPDDIPTTLVMAPSPSIPTPPGTRVSGDAESALADSSDSQGDAMASLMPALPISLGVGGGVLFIGVLAGMLYKKGKWPFRSRDRENAFEELEDGVAEKRFQKKWDPRSSMWRPNGATNF